MSLYLGDIPIANDGSHDINTPFFFGQSQYFENAPYNASWLASNGSYNASSLYPDFWVQLTGVELNGSLNVGDTIEIGGKTYVKRGLPVVLSTGTITDYDFVVNQNDQTFRLPLLNGDRVLVKKYVNGNAWYNLYSDGWIEQGGGGAADTFTIDFYVPFRDTNYTIITSCQTGEPDRQVRTMPSVVGKVTTTSCTLQACPSYVYTPFYWFACGYAAIPTQSDFTEVSGLYYYVGDTVQDASLINAGAVLGQLSNKADIDLSNVNNTGNAAASNLNSKGIRTVVETYKNGNSWYRVWSDGWIEQGGQTTSSTGVGTLNFIRPFLTTNYLFLTHTKTGNGDYTVRNTVEVLGGRATTGISVAGTPSFTNSYTWYACGY